VVGARVNVRSSYSQQFPVVAWIQTQVLTVASPAVLLIDLSRYLEPSTLDTELPRYVRCSGF